MARCAAITGGHARAWKKGHRAAGPRGGRPYVRKCEQPGTGRNRGTLRQDIPPRMQLAEQGREASEQLRLAEVEGCQGRPSTKRVIMRPSS